MPRKIERELRVHVTNPDAELDPAAIKRLAEWLVDFGIRVGTIPAPWAAERGCKDDTEKESADLQTVRQEVCAY